MMISSTGEARSLLGIPNNQDRLEIVTLRKAYFVAAKQCHPDITSNTKDSEEDGHERFLKVTEAYELLVAQLAAQKNPGATTSSTRTTTVEIPKSEEELFRRQCQEMLGLSAEIVEECKTNAGFRQWLGGNTDGAHFWRNFLMQHGGLAPRLPHPIILEIAAGEASMSQQRRRRPSRR